MRPTTCDLDHMGLPVPHPLYECCDRCNYADHRCPCCGDDLPHGVALCDNARAEYGSEVQA